MFNTLLVFNTVPEIDEPPKTPQRREYVGCRVSLQGVALIKRRAREEADNNKSEMVRRMLAYASVHMPKGWGAK